MSLVWPSLLIDHPKYTNSVERKGAKIKSKAEATILFLSAYLIVTVGVIVQLDNSRCYSGKGLKHEQKNIITRVDRRQRSLPAATKLKWQLSISVCEK